MQQQHGGWRQYHQQLVHQHSAVSTSCMHAQALYHHHNTITLLCSSLLGLLLNLRDEPVSADDVLQVLQQPRVALLLSLGLHQADLLHLTLSCKITTCAVADAGGW